MHQFVALRKLALKLTCKSNRTSIQMQNHMFIKINLEKRVNFNGNGQKNLRFVDDVLFTFSTSVKYMDFQLNSLNQKAKRFFIESTQHKGKTKFPDKLVH